MVEQPRPIGSEKMETPSTDPTLEKDNIVALLSVAGGASESIE